MASKYGLTAKKVPHLSLNDDGGKKAHADGRGLYVICEPSAKGITRSYNFRFTFEGKEVWHRMGHIDELTLDDARQKAMKYRAMIREGKDPRRAIDTVAAGAATLMEGVKHLAAEIKQGSIAKALERIADAMGRRQG